LEALVTLDKSKGSLKQQEIGRGAFFNAPKLENVHQFLEAEAEKAGTPTAALADAALLSLAARKTGSPEAKEMAQKALSAGWNESGRRLQIIRAADKYKLHFIDDKILAAATDPDKQVAQAASNAIKTLKLQAAADDKTPKVGTLSNDEILGQILKLKGDAALGEQLFTKATCVACHTVSQNQPQKGPYLGNIAQTYKRAELALNILDPNRTIAQGFTTNIISLNDGTVQMGFITSESGDKVTMRNAAAQEFTYAKSNIKTRETLPTSMMPMGLMANFTVREFASLLDYLEALAKQ